MEFLERARVRPRQARYQAALRPDKKCAIHYKALPSSSLHVDRVRSDENAHGACLFTETVLLLVLQPPPKARYNPTRLVVTVV